MRQLTNWPFGRADRLSLYVLVLVCVIRRSFEQLYMLMPCDCVCLDMCSSELQVRLSSCVEVKVLFSRVCAFVMRFYL